MNDVSKKQNELSKPLQRLTEQVNYEWSEFASAWDKVSFGVTY